MDQNESNFDPQPEPIVHQLGVDVIVEPRVAKPAKPPMRRWPLVTGGLLALALVGGVAGSALIFGSGGASSPTEAVENLATAISNEDMVGALTTMVPEEVRSLPSVYQSALSKAKAVGISPSDKTVAGVDLSVDGLALRSEELSPTVAKVFVTGGSFRYQFDEAVVDHQLEAVQDMTAGALIGSGCMAPVETPETTVYPPNSTGEDSQSDPANEDYPVSDPGTEQYPMRLSPTEIAGCTQPSAVRDGSKDLSDLRSDGHDPFLMAVKRDGNWFVSPMYTLAEYLNSSSDNPIAPDYAYEPTGQRADTAEQAAETLIRSLERLDVQSAIDATPPEELAVLSTYRNALERSVRGRNGDPALFTLSEVKYRIADQTPERARLVIEHLKLTNNSAHGMEESLQNTVELDHGCMKSGGGMHSFAEPLYISFNPLLSLTSLGNCSSDGSAAEPYLVLRNDGNGWAVSPVDSLMSWLQDALDHFDERTYKRLTTGLDEVTMSTSATVGQEVTVPLDDLGRSKVSLSVQAGQLIQLPRSVIRVDLDTADEVHNGWFGRMAFGGRGPAQSLAYAQADGTWTMWVQGDGEASELSFLAQLVTPQALTLEQQVTVLRGDAAQHYSYTADRPINVMISQSMNIDGHELNIPTVRFLGANNRGVESIRSLAAGETVVIEASAYGPDVRFSVVEAQPGFDRHPGLLTVSGDVTGYDMGHGVDGIDPSAIDPTQATQTTLGSQTGDDSGTTTDGSTTKPVFPSDSSDAGIPGMQHTLLTGDKPGTLKLETTAAALTAIVYCPSNAADGTASQSIPPMMQPRNGDLQASATTPASAPVQSFDGECTISLFSPSGAPAHYTLTFIPSA